jgi:hypothetical protein
MKNIRWQFLIALILVAGRMYAFPMWLEAPTRNNAHDPRSTLFAAMPAPPVVPPPPPPPVGNPDMIDDLEDRDFTLLASGGRDGSWYATTDSTDTPAFNAVVAPGGYAGSSAIRAMGGSTTPSSGWGGAIGFNFMAGGPYNASAYSGIKVYIKVGAGSQTALQLNVKDASTGIVTKNISATTTWALYQIDFPSCGLDTANLALFQVIPTQGMAADIWLDDASFTTGTPSSCFTLPGGAPVASWPIYTGTGMTQHKNQGGQGSSWSSTAGFCTETACTSYDPSPDFINGSAAPAHTVGANVLQWHFSWEAGYWDGGGYNWAAWWDMSLANCADGTAYDTLEFWIRGDLGGESGLTIQLTTSDGSCTGDGGSTNALALTGKYASCALTTSYQKVRIPLCDFDWSLANQASIWGINLSGTTQQGDINFFIADMALQKY